MLIQVFFSHVGLFHPSYPFLQFCNTVAATFVGSDGANMGSRFLLKSGHIYVEVLVAIENLCLFVAQFNVVRSVTGQFVALMIYKF